MARISIELNRWAVAAALLAGLPTDAATAYEVGAVAGEFSVTPDGQAAYTVPIQVPPGVLGVEPRITVGYHSGGGNGVLGLGGRLSGFSSITRCAANIAEDGFAAGVRHAPTDRFCLDGVKLVAVNGDYGADGTEYRTVPESYRKVVSHGAIAYPGGGAGPASFTVHIRSGGTLVFGNSDNARVRHGVSHVVHEWRVGRLSDVNGNTIDYVYQEFGVGAATEKHPVRIDYGANPLAGHGHHLAVHLAYEPRGDIASGFRSGIAFRQGLRLSSITTEADGDAVKVYRFDYDQAPASGESRLASIFECAADGVTCFAPTVFDWSTPASGWLTGATLPPDDLVDSAGRLRGIAVDLDGDGRTDWLTAYRDGAGDHRAAWLAGDSGFVHDSSYTPPEVLVDHTAGDDGAVLSELVDVNGDGLPDWVTAYRTESGNLVSAITLNDGNGFNVPAGFDLPVELTSLAAGASGMRMARFVDLDGDALIDVTVSTRDPSGTWHRGAWLNTGDGFALAADFLPPAVGMDYSTTPVGAAFSDLVDLDDDGFADWVRALRDAQGADSHAVWLNTGSGWMLDPGYALPTALTSYVDGAEGVSIADLVDVNGDGLLDVVQAHRRADGGEARQLWFNTGDGWQAHLALAPPVILAERTAAGHDESFGTFVDLDGDGRPDIARSYLGADGGFVSEAWRQNEGGWVQDNSLALPLPLHSLRADDDSVPSAGLVDMNHDGSVDMVRAVAGYGREARLNAAAGVHAVRAVTSGFGIETRIEYAASTDPDVYVTPAPGFASYPDLPRRDVQVLVGAVEAGDGIGGFNRAEHVYGGSRVNVAGRGALGFAWHTVVDVAVGIEIRSTYSQAYPHAGTIVESVKTVAGTVVSHSRQSLSAKSLHGDLTHYPYVSGKTTTTYDLDGAEVATAAAATEVDDFGNVIEAATWTTDVTGTWSETITNTWQIDTGAWVLGKLVRTTVQNTAPDVPPITRTTEQVVDTRGQVTQKVVEPAHPLAVTTSYTYDTFGNVTSTTASAEGMTDRTGSIAYTDDGRFPAAATNQLGHVLATQFDTRFGHKTRIEEPGGAVATLLYDELGRQVQERRLHVGDDGHSNDGTDVVLFKWCDSGTNCPSNALYLVGAIDDEGGSPETVYYDSRAREVRKQTHGFDGTAIYLDTEYDARGRKARVSRPYFEGTTPKWTEYEYDALDRVIRVVAPNGATTTTGYAGRMTTVTNALGQSAVTTVNPTGKPVEDVDAAGSVTRHAYDALGNLIETIDSLGNRISATFDVFGRKIAMSDPDMGSWSYEYDAFGRLVSQTDANSQTVTMRYDALDRMIERIEPEGTTTWIYDTAPNGVGRLAQVSQPGYTRALTYDDRGRPRRETVTIDGGVHVTEYAYEGTTERVDYIMYPNGWTIQKSYNEFGYPLDVRSVKATDAAAVVAQEQVYNDLYQAAVDRESDLAPARQDHYDQMVYYTGVADSLAAEAKRLANDANRKVEEYNQAASRSRQHARSARDHEAAANEIKRQIEWREGVYGNHIKAADAAAAQGSQYGYDRHIAIANQYADEINALVPQYDQKIHVASGQAYAANQWAQKANDHAAEAESLHQQAQNKVNEANARYRTANEHVDAINAIDRQVGEAVDAANDAHAQLEVLKERLEGNAVTHWAAQGASADGQITRFVLGNGIVTDLEYYEDTGRLARIEAMGDPALALPLSAQEIADYLDRLDALVADFRGQMLDFEVQAANAANEMAIAEAEAATARAAAEAHRDLGESALAIVANARALQLDVEVAVQQTRILLNEGLVEIHENTIAGALSLISQFEGAGEVPGQGRALQAAWHELLQGHYAAVENLYLGLSDTYAGLQSQAGDLEASPPTDESGFLELAAHSEELASFNELRAGVYDEAMIAAVEGGASSTPSTWRNLSLSAALVEQRGRLFDHHGDLVEAVYGRGRDLGAVFAAWYQQQGMAGVAGHYEGRSGLGEAKVGYLRHMAEVYKRRGTVLLGALDAEMATAGAETLHNPFAELAGLYSGETAAYTEMSTSGYWQDFYLGLGQRLAGATDLYAEQAGANAALAAGHGAEAAAARNANDHRLLVGAGGAIQDEQYFYDPIGNLTGRVDHAVDLDETFSYDALNRLTDSTLSGAGAELYAFADLETTTYAYDALGNLTERSDAGTYSYGSGPGSGAGVHAVTAISGLIDTAFAYDANGNQLSGHGRTIAWSSYNKPLAVSSGGATVTMAYGPGRELIKQQRPDGEGASETTYYIGSLYEKTVGADGTSRARYHISAAGRTVAVINENAAGAPETHYLHRDHLDSIVATSNERGQLIERFHFDPFGQRRLAVVGDDPLGTTVDLARSDRGFTGHRHLQAVSLIHMNGRVYDPAIGRFLSADPHVQYAGFSQSYNRYSYLMNNPLNAVDPSGYFSLNPFKLSKKLFKKALRVVKKVVRKVINFVKENIRTIVAIAVVVIAPYAVAALSGVAVGALSAGQVIAAGALGGGPVGPGHHGQPERGADRRGDGGSARRNRQRLREQQRHCLQIRVGQYRHDQDGPDRGEGADHGGSGGEDGRSCPGGRSQW